jgi:hypothetical protein
MKKSLTSMAVPATELLGHSATSVRRSGNKALPRFGNCDPSCDPAEIDIWHGPRQSYQVYEFIGDPERIRTADPQIRNLTSSIDLTEVLARMSRLCRIGGASQRALGCPLLIR